MKRENKVSVMLTDLEIEWLREVIGNRYLDGERVSMSSLLGSLAFHPDNPMLVSLAKEVSKGW